MSTPQIAFSINSKDIDNLKAYLAIYIQRDSLQTFNISFFTLPNTTIIEKYITLYLEVSAKY